MADPIWRTEIQKLFDLDKTRYSEDLAIADYDFEIKN